MRLIVATNNKDKFKEIKKILSSLKLEILYLKDLNRNFNIREDKKTFFENAFKKAKVISKIYKDDLVVGEDSGLIVDYIYPRPGVYSKRYAGKNVTYLENNLKLLKELEGVKFKDRSAKFICSVVLLKNAKLIKSFEGSVRGFISEKIMGNNGFGYDPIFYLPKFKKTFAELPLSLKNKISHRGKAFNLLKKYLKKYI